MTLSKGVHRIADAQVGLPRWHSRHLPEFNRHTCLTPGAQSATWMDINKQSEQSERACAGRGVRPVDRSWGQTAGKHWRKRLRCPRSQDVTYQYIVVPVTRPDRMNDDRGITILENSRRIQAVYHQRWASCRRCSTMPAASTSTRDAIATGFSRSGHAEHGDGTGTEITAADPLKDSRQDAPAHLRDEGRHHRTARRGIRRPKRDHETVA